MIAQVYFRYLLDAALRKVFNHTYGAKNAHLSDSKLNIWLISSQIITYSDSSHLSVQF